VRLLITRGDEDAAPLAEALRRKGVESLGEPLLAVVPVDAPAVDLGGVQALLATSANGVRAFAKCDRRRDLPLYAVGAATAKAAAEAGFARVETAGGDVEALARLVRSRLRPGDGALLHVSGSVVAGDLGGTLTAAGYAYRRLVLYAAHPAERFSAAAEEALRRGSVDGVILYSPRTARTFVALAGQAGLADACGRLAVFCLSAAVAREANAIAWRKTVVAARPDEAAMLEAILAARAANR
jgi:uroporphyrinogen-III synthase